MDRAEYDRIKAAVEATKAKRLAEAEEEYQSALKSLELVYAIAERLAKDSALQATPASQPIPPSNVDADVPPKVQRTVLSPTAIVRGIIRHIDGSFGHRDIAALAQMRLGTPMDSKAISSALNKLHKQGEIAQIVSGIGRRPAVYQRRADKTEVPDDVEKPLVAS